MSLPAQPELPPTLDLGYVDVGTRWRWFDDDFLTAADQVELTRVGGGDTGPTRRVAARIELSHSWTVRWVKPAGGVLASAVCIFVFGNVLPATAANWVSGVFFVAFLISCVFMFQVILRAPPQSDVCALIVLLLAAVREVERASFHFGEATHKINAASDRFFAVHHRRPRDARSMTRHVARRRFRTLRRPEAEQGVLAIGSQIWRLDGEVPERSLVDEFGD